MVSSARSLQKKRLARRLVLIAQAACDLQDLDAAFQVLQVAEILLNAQMSAKDRYGIVGLIVGTHVELWGLRHRDGTGLSLRSSLQGSPETLEV